MLSAHRHVILCLATLFILWAGLVNAGAERPISKPQSPITINISAETAQATEQTLSFEVTARTKITADEFTVFIQIPSGAELKEGDLFWRGSLQGGASKTIRFTLSFPSQEPQKVTAIARIQQFGRHQYAARAVYRLGQPVSRAATKSQVTDNRIKRSQRDGRSVIEYPLK